MTFSAKTELNQKSTINYEGFMSQSMFATIEAFFLVFVVFFICFDVIPALIEIINKKK